MRIRRLILWRHGRTEWNADARFQGHTDPPLDSLGAEQARVAASILAMERPDAIFTSDLVRASATASALAALTGLEVTADQRLRETSLGRWEGLTREEVEARFPQELADWQAGVPTRRGGGETAVEVADRAAAFLDSIKDTAGETVVLVAHGGTNKALAGRLLGLDPAHWFKIAPLSNCHWTELRRDSAGSWRLHRHNVGPLGAVHTPTEDAAESTPNVDSDEAATEPDAVPAGDASSGPRTDQAAPTVEAPPRSARTGTVATDVAVIESATGWPTSGPRRAPESAANLSSAGVEPPTDEAQSEPKTAAPADASPVESGTVPPASTPTDAAAPPATLTQEQVAGAYRYEQLRGHIPGPDTQPDV